MIGFGIRRVGKPQGYRLGTSRRPIITNVGSQSTRGNGFLATAALLASNHRLFVQMIPCREELLRQSHCDSCTLSFLDDGHKPRWGI